MNTKFLLILILLGALITRLWGINFGLPYYYFADEWYLIYWAFYSGSHALRPVYYLYAPLVPMILLFEFSAYYVGGYIFGIFSTPENFFIAYLSNPTVLTLIGRITIVIFGVATVWLVFIIGRKFFNQRIGLIAAFFLAFSFLHVKESHYIKQDVMMGFFVLAAFFFALNILQKGRLRDYILCGVAFALAFGAKYHAIIFLPIILLVHVLNTWAVGFRKLILFGIVFFITFSIIHPYIILETKTTLEKTLPFASGIRVGYPEQLQGKPVWWWYMFEHIPQGIGYPLFAAAALGFIICLFRGVSNVRYLFVPLLPIIFFITIDFFTQMHFARYAVVVLPYFMLGAAVFVDTVAKKLKLKKSIFFIALIIVYPTLIRAIQFDFLITRPDTRIFAKEWFEKNIHQGSKVLIESTSKPEHPGIVPLNLDINGFNKRIRDAEKIGQEALYLHALKQIDQDKIGYDIVATTRAEEVVDVVTNKIILIKDISYYVRDGVEYIILCGWMYGKSMEFKKSFDQNYHLIKVFRPTYEFRDDPHRDIVDYAALDRVNIFRRDMIFGPAISIYKLRPK